MRSFATALLFLSFLIALPQVSADVVLERTVQIRGFTIKIGPMEQKVDPREQIVKYYITKHGVRVEAVIGMSRRVLVFNRRANRIWTLDTTDSTYFEGILIDYAQRLKTFPGEKTSVTQDFPIVPLKFAATGKKGRYNGMICKLVSVVGQSSANSNYCISSFSDLGFSGEEIQTYRAFLEALAKQSNEISDSVIFNWQQLVGVEGIDIFGRYVYDVSGLPVRTAVTTTLLKIERRIIGSNIFSPPETYAQIVPGGEKGGVAKKSPKPILVAPVRATAPPSDPNEDIVDLHE